MSWTRHFRVAWVEDLEAWLAECLAQEWVITVLDDLGEPIEDLEIDPPESRISFAQPSEEALCAWSVRLGPSLPELLEIIGLSGSFEGVHRKEHALAAWSPEDAAMSLETVLDLVEDPDEVARIGHVFAMEGDEEFGDRVATALAELQVQCEPRAFENLGADDHEYLAMFLLALRKGLERAMDERLSLVVVDLYST